MISVVFLDVDGVLNNSETTDLTPEHFTGLDDILLQRLSTIISETKSVVVLTSTWKDEWNKDKSKCIGDGKYLEEKLLQYGVTIFDKVDDSKTGSFHRAASINNYLESHLDIEHYLILDDFEFDFASYPELIKHWIHTDESVGLTEDDIQIGINILRKER